LTLEALSQVLFTLAGLMLLLTDARGKNVLGIALVGAGIAVAGVFAMISLQRSRLLSRLQARLSRIWPALRLDRIGDFQHAIRRLHTARGTLAVAMTCHGTAWVLGSVEVFCVLALLNQHVLITDALIIESLAQALRNAGFMLPGAFAVQEGAIVAAAALVGVPPPSALAMALVRRTRELLVALPGLIAWWRAESDHGPAPLPAIRRYFR
jgi:uncharacterized membrane protein YbhN (UPF0104 family)